MERWLKGYLRILERHLIFLLNPWRRIKIIFIALSKASPAFHPLPLCADWSRNPPFSFGKAMRQIWNTIFGRKEPFGVMVTSIGRLAMPARRPFVTLLSTKAKRQRFIHEAEDLVVFSPSFNKFSKRRKGGVIERQYTTRRNRTIG